MMNDLIDNDNTTTEIDTNNPSKIGLMFVTDDNTNTATLNKLADNFTSFLFIMIIV